MLVWVIRLSKHCSVIILGLVIFTQLAWAKADTPINRYIIVLKEPTSAQPASKGALPNRKSKQYRSMVATQQQQFRQRIQQAFPTLSVNRQFDTLLNGLEVSVDKQHIAALSALPSVKKVYPVKMRYAHLDTSHQVIKSVEAWSSLGSQADAGRGVKIAIIDSGIQPSNPMFADTGFDAPDLTQNTWLQNNPDYCRAEDGDPSFCNNKVIIARVFEPSEDEALLSSQATNLSPLDDNRHGTHVAGIAAGNPIDVNFEGVDVSISGVAPGAYLMVYKALFDYGGIVRGSDAMLLEALEHAIKDGADVINNSWGSLQNEDPEDSVFAQVFKVAEDMGVVIINSAGNNSSFGDNAINCPGCIESGITVANSAHGRIFGHKITLDDSEIIASSGDNVVSFDDINVPLRKVIVSSNEFEFGCNVQHTEALTDAAVLVNYTNNCPLDSLVQAIEEKGGSAVLLYQDDIFNTDTLRPFNQFLGEFSLPVLGLTRADGKMLQQKADTQTTSVLISGSRKALINQAASNQLNPGSSVGPNGNPNVLKPDLTAPGTDILSAAAPKPDTGFPSDFPFSSVIQDDSPVFALISGTSMSSPMVAGAAALVRQAHPDWSPAQIKTALTSTASKDVKVAQAVATPFEQGAGIVDIPAAINAKLTFASSSHAHGACIANCSFVNTLTNVSDKVQTWTVDIELDNPQASYTMTQRLFTLSEANTAGAEDNIAFNIDTSDVTPGTWVFGKVLLQQNNQITQHLPIAVFANDNSDTRALSSNMSLQQDGTINATTRVKNISFSQSPLVEIQLSNFGNIIPSSINADVSNGQTSQLSINDSGQLIWQGILTKGDMSLTSATPWGATTLKELNVTPIYCDQGCTSFLKQVEFSFIYNGDAYSGVTISNNGFIIAGQTELQPYEINRIETLPTEDSVNNIIAPLWAEYDLRDPNDPFDTGSGELYADIIDWQGERYLVVEWNNVAPFGFEDNERYYTFQVIIKENSDEILFNYLDVQGSINATIGAENSDATLGVTLANGSQDLPLPIVNSPYALALTSQQAGIADIHYRIATQNTLTNVQADSVLILEDEATLIDVLKNDTSQRDLVINAKLNASEQVIEAKRLLKLPILPLDSTTLFIFTQPQNGSATLLEGGIEYVPNANFNGLDSLEYQVANIDGQMSPPTQVQIFIESVNDAPIIEPISQLTINAGQQITISATGIDPESSSLTWSWEQLEGPSVSLSLDNNTLSFIAPNSPQRVKLLFSVTAHDGELFSEAIQVTVVVEPEPSGGAILFSLMVLISLTISRQRTVVSNRRLRRQ